MIVSGSVYHRDWLENGGFLLPSKKNTRPQVAYLDSLRPFTWKRLKVMSHGTIHNDDF